MLGTPDGRAWRSQTRSKHFYFPNTFAYNYRSDMQNGHVMWQMPTARILSTFHPNANGRHGAQGNVVLKCFKLHRYVQEINLRVPHAPGITIERKRASTQAHTCTQAVTLQDSDISHLHFWFHIGNLHSFGWCNMTFQGSGTLYQVSKTSDYCIRLNFSRYKIWCFLCGN